MFLNFKLENYRSIGAPVLVDFVISKNQAIKAYSQEKNVFINKNVCLVGPNASGKSNILRGVMHFLRYITLSYKEPKIRDIKFVPHFCRQEKSSFFETEFIENGVQFRYSISILKNIVKEESLEEFNDKTSRYKYIFHRVENNEITKLRMEINKSDLDRLTDDMSLFSLLLWSNYWGKEGFQLLKENITTNVHPDGFMNYMNPFSQIERMSKALQADSYLLEELTQELRNIDTKIAKLNFIEGSMTSRDEVSGSVKERKIDLLVTEHNIDGKIYPLYLLEESTGTINFMNLFIGVFFVLKNGGILIFDELENSLHPDITNRIIDIFSDYDKNPNNAQLLFTTHNPLFLEKLSKTQIMIIEKNDAEQTELTRLDSIKGVRNDENYFIKYLNGEYGGQPRILEL